MDLSDSLQWRAFQRLIELLQGRENELMVLVRPLNRYIMAAENQQIFDTRLAGGVDCLRGRQIPLIALAPLSFDLYGG
ncbi:MAG: hypothetical protein M2R45_05018 [Verrucomicrobia subdivision 3 bacterium]|nr:hypothetical protein [Limisphaerales bacterium]MCS1417655.1 hypothetical protein [Limisphaerales bacterium]